MKLKITNEDDQPARIRHATPSTIPGDPSQDDTGRRPLGFSETDLAPGQSEVFTVPILDAFGIGPDTEIPGPRGAGPGDD